MPCRPSFLRVHLSLGSPWCLHPAVQHPLLGTLRAGTGQLHILRDENLFGDGVLALSTIVEEPMSTRGADGVILEAHRSPCQASAVGSPPGRPPSGGVMRRCGKFQRSSRHWRHPEADDTRTIFVVEVLHFRKLNERSNSLAVLATLLSRPGPQLGLGYGKFLLMCVHGCRHVLVISSRRFGASEPECCSMGTVRVPLLSQSCQSVNVMGVRSTHPLRICRRPGNIDASTFHFGAWA